ncbi:MAG: hypothetical protein ACTSRP_12495 [Candidatus Helarchaeota archaeon]
MVWKQLINKVVKIAYNDTPNSVAIITGKLLKEDANCICIDHNGIETIILNDKIVKISDYSFMTYIKCRNCGYYNWFPKDKPKEICHKCGGKLDEVE